MAYNNESPPPASLFQILTGSLRPWLIFGLVTGLFTLNSKFRSHFWHTDYLSSILQQSGHNIVLAVGASFVIMTAGIDLSVGMLLGICGVAIGGAMNGTLPGWLAFVAAAPIAALVTHLIGRKFPVAKLPSALYLGTVFVVLEAVFGYTSARGLAGGVKVEGAIAVALLVGAAFGLLNGFVISVGNVPPFVMTLGMMSAARGLTLYATDGNSVAASVPRFMMLGQGAPLAVIVLVVVALGTLLLKKTTFGRYVLSIGGNESASRLSGVSVAQIKTMAYVLSGVAAGIGAVLVTAKFGLADTNAGTGAELDAIAAVVIGGTSLSGGQGSIVGALVGALTITVIEAGLVLVGAPDILQPVILGVVIVLAVLVDQLRRRN